MTSTAAAERIATPARLEVYRDAMLRPDATLDAFFGYLRVLAGAAVADLAPDIADRDKARAVALGHLQGAVQAVVLHACSRFPAEIRAIPADVFAALLREVEASCRNAHNGCVENVLPWQYDGVYCSRDCELQDERCRP